MRTYVIGRSPHADIVLADPSVARRHAELLVSDDQRLFLTDCASDAGSWRRADHSSTDTNPDWLPLRQAFIDQHEPLRLGDYHCNARQLLQMASSTLDNDQQHNADHHGSTGLGARNEPTAMPRGAVERDPHTGEIIRRRIN